MHTAEMVSQEKEIQSITNEVPAIVQQAEAFKITNDLQFQECVELGNACKTKFQRVIEYFKPMKDAINASKQALMDKENAAAPPLKKAQGIYIDKAAAWQLAKQREQEEKERIAREKAQAIEDKKKADLQAKIDEENRKIAEAQKAGDEKAAQEAQAKAAAFEQKKEDVYVPAKPVQQAPRATGLSIQTVWEPVVTDESIVPVRFWKEIDLAKLKRMRKDDPKLEVPGIRFVERAQGAARG
jgi:hypothetical protein